MTRLSAEDVSAEIERFWSVFTSKAPELLESFYAAEATVFGSSAARAEPGRLAVARRRREYFDKQTSIRVQLGPIDVQVLEGKIAVASYTFTFHANRVAAGSGKAVQERLEHGRATQVFVLDAGENLRIVHEHLSDAAMMEH